MMDEAPFKLGQRVRMKFAARKKSQRGAMRHFDGVVVKATHWVGVPYPGWRISIKRDGTASSYWFWCFDNGEIPCDWEAVPLCEWSADQTARALAQIVLDNGDLSAAMALADRVFELCGATASQEATSPLFTGGTP